MSRYQQRGRSSAPGYPPSVKRGRTSTSTTSPRRPAALELLPKIGFHYVLTMVWHKPGGFQPHDLPQYNCEFVVYARRGAPVFIDTKDFNCCFAAPRREHSRKPDDFYDTVRRVTGGSRIDVFSREARDGFAQYGNETAKFGEAAA
jgi:N6-adenosine-specific RNA methylase IME4